MMHRRSLGRSAGAMLAAAAAGRPLLRALAPRARAAEPPDVIRVLGVSTGALADWSGFERDTGLKMAWTPASDDVGLFLHEMIANDGGDHYDIVTCLSGTYEMLAEQGLLLPIDLTRLRHWQGAADYVRQATPLAPGAASAWSIPYHMNADSFIYAGKALRLPSAPTEISWKLLYDDPATRGRVALDNEVYALGCAAIYLKHHRIVDIADIADMSPSECNSVANFLIERKQAGQFRTLYRSFDEQLQLIAGGEALAETGWEPVARQAQARGLDAAYADTVEGYDKWAQNLMVPAQVKDRGATDRVHAAIDWLLGGAYAAEIAVTQGYVTPRLDLGLSYARAQGWDATRLATISAVAAKGARKFTKALYWDPGFYRNLERYELEMARFRNA